MGYIVSRRFRWLHRLSGEVQDGFQRHFQALKIVSGRFKAFQRGFRGLYRLSSNLQQVSRRFQIMSERFWKSRRG